MPLNRTFSFKKVLIKSKLNKSGEAPIYIRINVDGKFSDVATKLYVSPERWNSEAQSVIGTKEDARTINKRLESYYSIIWGHYDKLLKEDQDITADLLKKRILGSDHADHTLLELVQLHNKMFNERVGIEFAPGTAERYKTLEKHIKEFLKHVYNLGDIKLNKMDHQFALDLEHYFKVVRGCNHNSTHKYIKNLKKIINLGIKKNWLEKDPFANFKSKLEEVEREFLTTEELSSIQTKIINIERVALVRDIFIFSCYTGLAYIDVFKLTKDKIFTDDDGEKWIHTKRTKTETRSHIPLLKPALDIIAKYSSYPECMISGKLLPVKSNQKMNEYLKEIADICGIRKNLTFHVARHTFATTVTLTNDVPIETVSAMLGHKSIKTTQHYAKILDKKVSKDMKNLTLKLGFS